MTLKVAAAGIGAVGGLAAFVVYLVVSEFAAVSWAAIATVLAAVLAWDLWKNHRVSIERHPPHD